MAHSLDTRLGACRIHHSGGVTGLGAVCVQLLSESVTGLGAVCVQLLSESVTGLGAELLRDSGLDSSHHVSWLLWHCVDGEGKLSQ